MNAQIKTDAEISLLQAQAEKIRAELATLNAERQSKKPKIGGFLIEFIKVFGALILGAGGVIAAYSGYQLSEVKKERYELDARKALEEANRTKFELENLNLERKKAQESLAAMTSQLSATHAELAQLTANLTSLKSQPTSARGSLEIETAISSVRRLEAKVSAVGDSAKDIQQGAQSDLYFVISMTSANRADIDAEINRIRTRIGSKFAEEFSDVEAYHPQGGLYTLLVSKNALPYAEATKLKQRAISAGFSKDTWLWQSKVSYFTEKR